MDNDLLEIFVRELKLQCVFARIAFNGMIAELQSQPERQRHLDEEAQKLSERHRAERDALLYGPTAFRDAGENSDQEYQELFDRHTQEMIELYEDGPTLTVFFFTYSFLVHAAIVSKILWSGTTVHGKEKNAVGPEKVQELVKIRETRSTILRSELEIEGKWAIESTALRNDLEHYDERIEAWYLTSPRRNSMDFSLLPRSSVEGFDAQDFRRNLDPTNLSFFIEDDDYDLPSMMKELDLIYEKARTWLHSNSRYARARRSSGPGTTPASG